MRKRMTEDRARPGSKPASCAAADRVGCSAERCDAEQQRLLQNEDEGGRHNIAGVAACRIEQRLGEEIDRRGAAGHRRIDKTSLVAGAACRYVVGDCRSGFRYALKGPAVD